MERFNFTILKRMSRV